MVKKTIKRKGKSKSGKKNHFAKEVPLSELKSIISQIKAGESVNADDIDKLDAAVDTLAVVTSELEHKRVSVARLKKLLFGDTTEKMSNVFPETKSETQSSDVPGEKNEKGKSDGVEKSDTSEENTKEGEKQKRKGHGRNGADRYTGAQKVQHQHDSLRHKDPCPEEGCNGKVYLQKEPKRLVRVTGIAPLKATVHELERFRCNLCGKIFTAKAPENVGEETYDNRARVMIAMLKYGCGTPFYRLEKLEGSLGIPLPSSTQWDEAHRLATPMIPMYTELIELAANGEVLYNDDTVGRILNLGVHLGHHRHCGQPKNCAVFYRA